MAAWTYLCAMKTDGTAYNGSTSATYTITGTPSSSSRTFTVSVSLKLYSQAGSWNYDDSNNFYISINGNRKYFTVNAIDTSVTLTHSATVMAGSNGSISVPIVVSGALTGTTWGITGNNSKSVSFTGAKPATYTIVFDANGGTGAPSSQTKTHGTDLVLSSTKPTKTGYTFVRWVSTRSNGSTVNYQPGNTVTYEGNQTLVAQWKAYTYTITYNANGGTDAPSEQTKTYGVTLTLSSDVPTRSGYTFLGWATSSSATSPTYYVGSSFKTNADTILYAVWETSGEKTIISLNKKVAKLTDGIRLNFNVKNSTNKHTIIWTSGNNSLTTHTNNSLSAGTFEYLLSEERFASWFGADTSEISVTVTVTTYNSSGVSLGTSSAAFTLVITEELGKPNAPTATLTNKSFDGATISLVKPTFKYNSTFVEWKIASNIGEASVSGDVVTINVDSNLNKTGVATIQVVDSRGFLSDPVNIVWRVRSKDVYVFDNTSWSSSTPYMYVDGQWKKCGHAIYDDLAWVSDGIRIDLVDKYLLTSDGYNLVTSDMLYLKGKKG